MRTGLLKPAFGTRLDPAHPLSMGLAGCWLLNDGGNYSGMKSVTDSSPNKNHGTLTGFTYPSTTMGPKPGRMGPGVLNASGTYVNVPHSPSLSITDKISIMCWFTMYANNSNSGLLYKGGLVADQGVYAFGFFQGVANKMSFRLNSLAFGMNSGTTLPLNQLICAVAVYDRLNGYIYINGKQDTKSTSYTTAISTNTNMVVLGAYYQSPFAFVGQMETSMVWNRALRPEEVRSLYASPFQMFK